MGTARAHLLPGAPRAGLAVVGGLAVLGLAAAPGGGPGSVTGTATVVLTGALTLALGGVLHWRALRVRQERAVWTRLTVTAALLGLGALGTALCSVVPGWQDAGALPACCAVVVTFPAVYGGLLRWNRYSTSLADPNDTLNGCSAVAVAVAIGNLVVDHVGGRLDELPDWRLQPLLAAAAATVVYIGTTWVMAVIAELRRDPRIWLVTGALTAVCAASLIGLVTSGTALGWLTGLTALAVALVSAAAALQPRPSTPQPADPVDSTVGAFVVITVATLSLAVDALTGPTWVTTACAGAAAIGSSLRLLVNVRDLAQLAISRREALTDDLTGLANRRAVVRQIEDLCSAGDGFALALIDLDKFKEVNDGLGHSAGDDLLRLVARRLESRVRQGELVGRLGGDEFAVVVPITGGQDQVAAATALGAHLQSWVGEPYELAGLTLHVGVSAGIAVHGHPAGGTGSCSTQLLRHADTAMYEAKRTGAGAVLHDSSRHVDTSGRLALVEELRTGLATGQLVLHHQPQVDVRTGRTVGVEALVRWEHPTRGLLTPADFLPLAELHGLMGPLTERVLQQAVAQLAQWRRERVPLRMSVNLSASNLLDTGLPGRLADLLAQHGVPASALVLEVTETVLMSDPELSMTVVSALADLGSAVSIDDFGTGYASLTYLRELPVAELKLDRSFTADLLTDARAAAIVSSTIELAHRLGLRVVAEGVEQVSTLAQLEALGCDETQGYLHARPLPAAELRTWLAAAEPLLPPVPVQA
ncbi:EAL domain-containing protein [Modestobacter sp. NPDC049651]|uniref:putative bifunctional diguanylate cyclase/phosphodiesterase n=1 Tax=unclassified Modestobacter TaxID=2643866 RepID=UPI0033E7944D